MTHKRSDIYVYIPMSCMHQRHTTQIRRDLSYDGRNVYLPHVTRKTRETAMH